MATLTVGDILKVRVACINLVQSAFNITHFRVTATAGVSAEDDVVATYFNTLLAPLYKAILSTKAEYIGVGVQKISPDPMFVEVVDISLRGFGSSVANAMPPQIAGLGRKFTRFARQPHRGYTYLPFPGDSDNAPTGGPGAPYITRAEAIMAVYGGTHTPGAAGNTSTLAPIIFHSNDNTYTEIISTDVKKVWSNQKRRSFVRPGDAVPLG